MAWNEESRPDLCWFCGKPNTDYEDIGLMAPVHESCKENAILKQDKVKTAIHHEREMGEAIGRFNCHPCEGGCWYCKLNDCDVYDSEFDTMLHLDCLKRVLEIDPNHPEAIVQSYLLDDHVP